MPPAMIAAAPPPASAFFLVDQPSLGASATGLGASGLGPAVVGAAEPVAAGPRVILTLTVTPTPGATLTTWLFSMKPALTIRTRYSPEGKPPMTTGVTPLGWPSTKTSAPAGSVTTWIVPCGPAALKPSGDSTMRAGMSTRLVAVPSPFLKIPMLFIPPVNQASR